MITALILLPLIGAGAIAIARDRYARTIALSFTGLTAAITFLLWRGFDTNIGQLQLIERHSWIPSIGAEYLLALDGLSLLLVLLTTLLFPFALLAERGGRGLCALMLLMQSALYGTFTAQNFVLWFLFYEMSLVPSFLLIKMYGGEKRDRAATKFFVYTFLASLAMLLGMLGVYLHQHSFDFVTLASAGKSGAIAGKYVWLVFVGIFFGLAVKVPIFPFHTWLPDAYETAPTGVTMVLTGILSKMGVYGFIRLLLPLFPNEIRIAGPWLLTLAVCSIVIAPLAAWAQTDLKRMVAYLSINHLGYCLLGLFAISATSAVPRIDNQAAFAGVFLQIFNHGLTAATLFYFVGLLERRRGGRLLSDFGGLMQRAPVFCACLSVAMFSSLGLPGLNGFIGEFLIFKSAFTTATIFTAVALLGLLFTAVTFINAMQKLFSGPSRDSTAGVSDLGANEKWIVAPVLILMFAIGLAPQFLFTIFNSTVVQIGRLFLS